MSQEPPEEVTQLLHRIRQGDDEAVSDLLPAIHAELHSMANRLMRGESPEHTLQATALVNEAYLRMFGGEKGGEYEDKRHFIRVAARAMRGVLIDHARAKKSQKRGGGASKVPLDEMLAGLSKTKDLDALSDALDDLSEMDPELSQIVDLRYFAGFSIAETAEVMEVSTPTIERRWRIARAWLKDAVRGEEEEK